MPDSAATIPWDQLLTDIHKRQVLPIIGPAFVTLEESGTNRPLRNWFVRSSAKLCGF